MSDFLIKNMKPLYGEWYRADIHINREGNIDLVIREFNDNSQLPENDHNDLIELPPHGPLVDVNVVKNKLKTLCKKYNIKESNGLGAELTKLFDDISIII